ncbi:ABC transporter permease [Marinilactibacillus sp. XAAS-LB27]|uniref:ABC transporter permease n=1 Tax=Marinilactibacillus sp. XAAS-LB27 TaxID=3114538 RepID=UPI002E196894|nr:ABC transporter permease [Marinilactibacillus sp. XAAS-LB27]
MFLAWKEIKHSKTRFALIIGIVVLVSYLVSFLTGLAYGLAQENRTAVDKWDADGIVLTNESNLNLNSSMFEAEEQDYVTSDEKAVLGVSSNIVRIDGSEDTEDNINVTIFGVESNEFLNPEIVEGDTFEEDTVVADISLSEEEGLQVGDMLKLSGQNREVKIAGFTDGAKFSVTPVLYTTVETFQKIKYDVDIIEENQEYPINGIVVRNDGDIDTVSIDSDDLEVYSTSEFINKLPGYNAQVLTFGLMIGFLVLIAALVIGIFIYVLTLQKASMLGVMKAQGISSGYIAKSVIAQTFLLALIGVLIGFGLTILTGFFLPSAVPYQNNYLFLVATMASLIVFALMGAVFSVRTVVKIDPLEAIE